MLDFTSSVHLFRRSRWSRKRKLDNLHSAIPLVRLTTPLFPPTSLSSRFATGASVSKSVQNPGVDEIVVQGDVADDVRDLILSRTKPFHELPSEKDGGPSEKNIAIEEDKKSAKKAAAAAAGAAPPTDD